MADIWLQSMIEPPTLFVVTSELRVRFDRDHSLLSHKVLAGRHHELLSQGVTSGPAPSNMNRVMQSFVENTEALANAVVREYYQPF